MIKKLEMKYLVLKMNDEIDVNLLYDKLYNYSFDDNITIKDISLLILNCIKKIGDKNV